jgi:hypothetical protein
MNSGRDRSPSAKIHDMKLFALLAILVFFALVSRIGAQVPAEFINLDNELEGYLTNFDATLDANWNGALTNCLMAATLMPATSGGRGWANGAGDAAKDANFLNSTVVPYLNALQALGIKSIKFAIQYPVLYQPYYNSNNGTNDPKQYTDIFNFYTNLVVLLRQRGMKIIIPTESIIANNTGPTASYEQTLTFAQFVAGRSVLNQTIARHLQPDYLILQSEPDTEAANLPPSLGNQITNAAADMLKISRSRRPTSPAPAGRRFPYRRERQGVISARQLPRPTAPPFTGLALFHD